MGDESISRAGESSLHKEIEVLALTPHLGNRNTLVRTPMRSETIFVPNDTLLLQTAENMLRYTSALANKVGRHHVIPHAPYFELANPYIKPSP